MPKAMMVISRTYDEIKKPAAQGSVQPAGVLRWHVGPEAMVWGGLLNTLVMSVWSLGHWGQINGSKMG
jgi:hypothetical protein